MNYRDVLLGLLPPVSYARNAPRIRAQAETDGRALDNVRQSAQTLAAAVTPVAAAGLIADWERVLDLDGAGKSYAQRVAAAVAKINASGGLSIPYFTALAAAAGYTVRISEPQPFRAGTDRAGGVLAPEDIIYTWRVHVAGSSQRVWRFCAGTGVAGERLSSYGDAVIESVIQDLKPAHTWVGFSYD